LNIFLFSLRYIRYRKADYFLCPTGLAVGQGKEDAINTLFDGAERKIFAVSEAVLDWTDNRQSNFAEKNNRACGIEECGDNRHGL
jgi:hypothetical protein